MVLGFVLVTTSAGMERMVYEVIKDIEEVKDAHPLFGEYDIILKLDAESHDKIASIVVDSIRKIPGVIDTKTLIRINGEYGDKQLK
jgi:DNA-binding Lrp family transcriptional regulator